MNPNPVQIQWAIKEIKELEFFIDESIDLGPSFDFNFTVEIRPLENEEIVRLGIIVNYAKTDTKEQFMRGKVVTSFLIKDLKTLVRKIEDRPDLLDLPEQLWVALFSIAFTHARAILSRSSAGTKYAHMLLPAINPEAEFRKLFGNHVKQKEV